MTGRNGGRMKDEAARCVNTKRPLTEPPYERGGSAVRIILPSDVIDYSGAPGWRADDLAPADVARLLPRFRSYYTEAGPDECWEWRGHKLTSGYGVLSARPRRANLLVHRIAWVAATGQALTDNLTIDHLCFNRPCVNPAHLEPVTMAENVSRARRAALGGRLQTKEEARAKQRETERRLYWADPEKARTKKAVRKPCPECGGLYRSSSLARHRRTHGGAA
jgi:hypothetical protein